MADPYGFTDFGAESQEIERRRKYAEMLRQQSMEPIQQQTAGGWVVPISPFQGAGKLAQAYFGKKKANEADEKQKALAEALRNERMGTLAQFQSAMDGRPEEQGTDPTGGLSVNPGQAPNPKAAMMALALSRDPSLSQAGVQGYMKQSTPDNVVVGRSLLDRRTGGVVGTDATWKAEQEAAREARAKEIQMKLADARTQQEERAALQREMTQLRIDAQREAQRDRAAFASANRVQANKPPVGFRYTPNGDLERIPGGPADIKAEADLQKRASGSGDVDVALGTLRDAYTRLESGGGITSTKKDGLSNVGPAIASSPVGQAVGKMFGTNNQSARNDIAMARPALLAALMKATGMSAKQMDSNAELKLWLSTATDPTLDVESNRRALDNIEKKYLNPKLPGTGATGDFSAPKNTVPDAPPPGAVRRKQ